MDTYISLFPLANELLVNYIGPESRSCMRDPAAFAHISFFTWSSGGFGPAASRNFRLHVRWLWIHCIIFYFMVTFALLDPMITLQGHGWYWFLIETFSFYFISRRRKKRKEPFCYCVSLMVVRFEYFISVCSLACLQNTISSNYFSCIENGAGTNDVQ